MAGYQDFEYKLKEDELDPDKRVWYYDGDGTKVYKDEYGLGRKVFDGGYALWKKRFGGDWYDDVE